MNPHYPPLSRVTEECHSLGQWVVMSSRWFAAFLGKLTREKQLIRAYFRIQVSLPCSTPMLQQDSDGKCSREEKPTDRQTDICSSLNIWELKIYIFQAAKSFIISFVWVSPGRRKWSRHFKFIISEMCLFTKAVLVRDSSHCVAGCSIALGQEVASLPI